MVQQATRRQIEEVNYDFNTPNINNLIEDIKNIKLFLHSFIYNKYNFPIINDILKQISMSFNLFNINYEDSNKSIQIKIKKTDMKKSNSFTHDSQFYYSILNNIFCNIFTEHKDLLRKELANLKLDKNIYKLDLLTNPDMIGLIFNITTLLDNIIIIYL